MKTAKLITQDGPRKNVLATLTTGEGTASARMVEALRMLDIPTALNLPLNDCRIEVTSCTIYEY